VDIDLLDHHCPVLRVDDFIDAENGTVVVEQINIDLDELTDEEITANANLIAAAPDLYEALTEALDLIDGLRYGLAQGYEPETRVARHISAALAKARGEKPGVEPISGMPESSSPNAKDEG